MASLLGQSLREDNYFPAAASSMTLPRPTSTTPAPGRGKCPSVSEAAGLEAASAAWRWRGSPAGPRQERPPLSVPPPSAHVFWPLAAASAASRLQGASAGERSGASVGHRDSLPRPLRPAQPVRLSPVTPRVWLASSPSSRPGSAAYQPGLCPHRNLSVLTITAFAGGGQGRVEPGPHAGLALGTQPRPPPASCPVWPPCPSRSLCRCARILSFLRIQGMSLKAYIFPVGLYKV